VGELQALGNEINRKNGLYEENKGRLDALREAWVQVFAEVPEEIRPVNPEGDAFAIPYLEKVMEESKKWYYEKNRIEAMLKPAPKAIPEWMKRVQQISAQDEDSLSQVYMAQANVIGAMSALTGSPQFSRQCQDFDCVVIDEANQATPPEMLLPMLKGKKIVLVGDGRNLSPMIGSYFVTQLAEDLGLPEEEVERVGKSYFIEMFQKCPYELCLSLLEDA
jgi:superfamily I DNA and/or RNA helicase